MSELALHPTATLSTNASARYAVPVARTLFALLFIVSGIGHFSSDTIAWAAAAGVPLANLAVPASGALAIAGALGVLLGYRARLGALALIAFLLPVTFKMHAFWTVTDPMMAAMEQVNFLKNLSLVGGAMLIAFFGAGPISLDARANR